VANETGLYLWVNPSGLPNAAWQRYSLSYAHNEGWSKAHPGETSYLFDERVNASNEFETQAYTSLMKVGANEAIVVYNKYWAPRDGWPGCYPSTRGCSAGFGMRITLKTDDGVLPQAIELFVVGGSPGAALPPMHFRTLIEARDAIRALPKSAKSRGVIVNVATGNHHTASPQVGSDDAVLMLDDADSGNDADSPIVWRGQDDAVLPSRITSSVAIPAHAWQAAGKSPHGHALYKANLSALGLHNLSDDFNTNQGQCGNDGNRSELFFGGRPAMLARHPNVQPDGTWNWLRQGAIVPNSTRSFYGHSRNAPNRCMDAGYPGCDQPWANSSRIYVHGFWHFDWSDPYQKVTVERVGNASSGANLLYTLAAAPHYGLQAGSRYIVLNSLSITDAPGEFFIDVHSGILYFIPPPQDNTTGLKSTSWTAEEIVVSTGADLVSMNGTQHVTFENLALEYSRRDGLVAFNVSDVHIVNCTIANIGANGISITGQDCSVRNSTVRDVGCAAVTVSGGDIKTLTSSGLFVENNDIGHYGRISRSKSPGVGWGGVGVNVLSNEIHHAPHSGIMHLGGTSAFGAELSSASANSLFANNFLHDLCQGTADSGAFYSGRSWAHRGNRLVNNTFARIYAVESIHETGSPISAVYLDDMEAGWLIESNTFDSALQGIYLNGGRENSILSNVFVNCSVGVGWAVHRPCNNNSAETACFGGFLKQLEQLQWLTPPASTAFHINIQTQPCNPALNTVHNNRYCHPTGSKFLPGFDNFSHLVCGTRLCPHEPGHAGVIFRGPASWNSTFFNNTPFACPPASGALEGQGGDAIVR
jgi:parallel beta-helix repeat protein